MRVDAHARAAPARACVSVCTRMCMAAVRVRVPTPGLCVPGCVRDCAHVCARCLCVSTPPPSVPAVPARAGSAHGCARAVPCPRGCRTRMRAAARGCPLCPHARGRAWAARAAQQRPPRRAGRGLRQRQGRGRLRRHVPAGPGGLRTAGRGRRKSDLAPAAAVAARVCARCVRGGGRSAFPRPGMLRDARRGSGTQQPWGWRRQCTRGREGGQQRCPHSPRFPSPQRLLLRRETPPQLPAAAGKGAAEPVRGRCVGPGTAPWGAPRHPRPGHGSPAAVQARSSR